MSQLTGRTRRYLAIGALATGLAVGGGVYASAAGDDPAQNQDYVTIVDEPTPSPSTSPDQNGQQQNGRDCPEKDGSGQQGSGESQGQQGQQGSADPEGQA